MVIEVCVFLWFFVSVPTLSYSYLHIYLFEMGISDEISSLGECRLMTWRTQHLHGSAHAIRNSTITCCCCLFTNKNWMIQLDAWMEEKAINTSSSLIILLTNKCWCSRIGMMGAAPTHDRRIYSIIICSCVCFNENIKIMETLRYLYTVGTWITCTQSAYACLPSPKVCRQ